MTLFHAPSFPPLKLDDDLDTITADDGFEGPLCVPDDPVEDLEWYPGFADGAIGVDDLPPPQELRDGEDAALDLSSSLSDGGVPKKQRCKRSGRRVWSVSPPVGLLNPTSRDGGGGDDDRTRTCSHCMVEETPQWRTGPDGPGTLCNACGIRYKSGRLLPEYRPSASPTFVGEHYSNSHKKVLKMRYVKQTSWCE